MKSNRLIGLICIVAIGYFASSIIIPFVLSLILFFLLDPFVIWAEKKGVPRAVNAPLVVITSMGLITLAGWLSYNAAVQITAEIPKYSEKIKYAAEVIEKASEKLTSNTSEMVPHHSKNNDIQRVEVVQGYSSWTKYFITGMNSIFGLVNAFFIIPLFSYMFLIEKENTLKRLGSIIKSRRQLEWTLKEIGEIITGFFVWNFLIGLLSTVAFYLTFSAIGLDNRVALSLGAGFLNLVPLIGSIAAMIFPLAQALLQFSSVGPFVVVAGGTLIIHFVIGNLILPKAIGPRIDLNVLAASAGLMFWGWLWGPLGLFLGIPLTAIVKTLLATRDETRSFAVLLSEGHVTHSPIILETSPSKLIEA